jgi:hypothetical protein
MEHKESNIRTIPEWIEFVKESLSDQSLKDKRIKELHHIASFTTALKKAGINSEEIEIIELRVEPDFVINYKNERIGVEVTSVINAQAKSINDRKKLLKQAAAIFEEKYPGIKLVANIEFAKDFDEIQNNSELVLNEIVDFVYEYSLNGDSRLKPKYIETILCFGHSNVSFDLSGAYGSSQLNSNNINDIILHKNDKIDSCKVDSNLSKVWLLLVVMGNSPYSDYSHVDVKSINVNNSFDSVFLLNDFKKEVIIVKKGL